MMSGIDSSLTSSWASSLFTKLDTQSKGYLEKADLQSAFGSVSDNSDSSSVIEDIFELMDSDGDGKVTEGELATAFSNTLTEPLRGPGGAPPPPPSQTTDEGFTKEQLTSQLEEIDSSDNKRASLISNIVQNFDAADTNKDGKVSFSEAVAYDQENQASDPIQASSDTSTTEAQNTEAMMARQIMNLLKAYNIVENPAVTSADSGLSVSA